MDRSTQINTFSRFFQVSRETIISLEKYEELLINANKKLNLISKSTINFIWHRHILDSFQVIDFIDKNKNTLIDIGSGAGFPGIILAIAAKDRKIPLKISLIEKSPKKINFLNQVIKKLDLEVDLICQDVFKNENKLTADILTARAFKPFPIFLKLIHNKAINWNLLFVFLGKTGNEQLLQASKSWHIQYKRRVSITDNDSTIIEVNNLKKK